MKHAKPANFGSFMDDVAEACADLWRIGRRAAVSIAALPWPVLLAVSILLAFAITIVPLALALFVLFLLVKLVAGLIIVNKRRHGD